MIRAAIAGIAAFALVAPAGAQAATPPEWSRDAVLYGVVVERVGEGGDFESLRRRLDYLDRLGVDVVWLSPVNATVPDDFGYAVTDYRRLRPAYGTKREFRRLIDAAHRRGIRVLMDLVVNHTSRQHRWFTAARERGPGSRFWSFYERDRDGEPKHYFDWDHLPNLNFGNPAVRKRILAISAYWVREFGVDGYRVDAAWGVRRRAPGFWPRWSRRLRAIDPEVLLLAEASARRGWYARHGFDAAYDWSLELGQAAWSGAFDEPARAGERLARLLRRAPNGPAGSLVLRFLDNNDTGERFAVRHGAAMARLAATVELTVPGLPLVYMGQENGADYDPYSLAEPLDFRDRLGLRPLYRRLIALRHGLPALGGRRIVEAGEGLGSTLAYVRPAAGGGAPVLVAVNFGERGHLVPLSSAAAPFANAPLRDELTGEAVALEPHGAGWAVRLRARSARVLVPAG